MSSINENNFYDCDSDSESVEEIRQPDRAYFDRLIDNRNDEDIEMEKIINESITMAEKKSDELIEELIEEMNIRKQKYSDILLKFKKIVKYDKEIKEIFDFIEFIIGNYIDMQLEYYTYDKKTYDTIFNIKLLKQIRLTDYEIELLREIILFQDN